MSQSLPAQTPLLDRISMLFNSAGYYGVKTAPTPYLVATLMADLRMYVKVTDWDEAALNSMVKKREEENESGLRALGLNPDQRAQQRSTRKEIVRPVDPADAQMARDAIREGDEALAKRRRESQ